VISGMKGINEYNFPCSQGIHSVLDVCVIISARIFSLLLGT
jgi:hypothetical protein